MNVHELELKISALLRRGVIFSGFFLLTGWIGMLVTHGDRTASFHTYHRQPFFEIFQWALITQDRFLIVAYAGLWILVTLPLLRVFLTAYLFARQKERVLSWMAYIVFAVLVCSFFLGVET